MDEIRLSSAEILEILKEIKSQICPFTLTQDGRDYTVQYHSTHCDEFYVVNHGYWSLSTVANWFEHSNLINGKRFEEFYSEFSFVDVSGVEELL